ncbi:MFS transporter [Paenibacillus pinistramenti]|uniref:MFS transporter n=1 Tax=Paenibacillus pinistramenti TaxID=1768003 RepID=UPI0011080869|nr:MFS transporter [Paenibacillus pinistramenti]
MRKLIWISGLSYLLIGFAHVIIGSIMPVLLEHYDQDYTAGGTLIFAQFAGFLIGVLVSPWLIGRMGNRKALLLAMVFLFAAELAYTFLPAWHWMYVIGAFAGFGFGMIEAVIGTLIIAAAADQAAMAMSRIEVAFGVGALLMPLISGWLIRSDSWRYAFLIISMFSLAMIVVWFSSRFGALQEKIDKRPAGDNNGEIAALQTSSSQPKSSWLALYSGPRALLLIVFVLFFFLYVGTEMGFVNFLPSMLIEKTGSSEASAAYGVTAFWIAMSAGRIYAGVLAQRIGFAKYIVSGIVVALIFMALFTLVQHEALLFGTILVIGLFLSGIFSISLVYATRLLPGSEETTPSLLIASGGVGGAVLPLLLGNSMDEQGARFSGWLLAGVLALMLVLSLVIVLINRLEKPKLLTTTK